jgi:hypothetical protein
MAKQTFCYIITMESNMLPAINVTNVPLPRTLLQMQCTVRATRRKPKIVQASVKPTPTKAKRQEKPPLKAADHVIMPIIAPNTHVHQPILKGIEPNATPKKKHAANTATQLSASQMCLLGSTTGAFKGQNDSHAIFLTHGKNIAALAKADLLAKQKQTDLGLLDEILVEKGPKGLVYPERVLQRLRKRYKENLKIQLTRKAQVLEELRILLRNLM